MECRHGRPECECQSISSQPLSSGRWDAIGSWEDATSLEREKAFKWANNLEIGDLYRAVLLMASDINAFTLYERTAILEVVAIRLKWEMKERRK